MNSRSVGVVSVVSIHALAPRDALGNLEASRNDERVRSLTQVSDPSCSIF
jgi:hypothetical protein